jgi:heptosyltransferase-3
MVKEWGVLKRVRKERYDLVINLTEGDRGAIAALVSGAKWRVGFDPEGKGFFGKRNIYTQIVKMCKTPRHTVEKNLDALRRIGIFPGKDERDLFFSISEKETKRAQELLGGLESYILIHPASRWKFKCWPVEKVAELIQELHARGERIVMTASPDPQEIQMVEEILAKVLTIPVLNLAGKTSLKELGALIQMSRLLFCVDSVPLHMASASKTPVVVLFGPSSEVNWGPWNHPRAQVVTQNFSCRPCFMDGCGGSKRSDCLVNLPVSRVLNAIQSLNSSPK